MKIIECEQGSEEWLKARAGKVTASRIKDVMAKGKGSQEAVTRRDYKFEIVTEILTGNPTPQGYQSEEMRHGNEFEPFARAEYELRYGTIMVEKVGLVLHPTIDRAAASPDGLVGDTGLIEIKCPKTATHISYLQSGEVPSQYKDQMLWQMACTERLGCDFVSYDPRLPENLQLFVVPFKLDSARVEEIENEVRKFLQEVDEIIHNLRKFAA